MFQHACGKMKHSSHHLCTVCVLLNKAAEMTVALISPHELRTLSRGSCGDQGSDCRHMKFLFASILFRLFYMMNSIGGPRVP